VRRLAREEREDFAAFPATLSPRQWQAPTLCAQWRVRDVITRDQQAGSQHPAPGSHEAVQRQ